MKNLLFFLFLVFASVAHAQEAAEKCNYVYFKNGKVSTKVCHDKSKGTGHASAYNSSGKLIYQKQTSHHHLRSSVTFTYYPSGAVQKAEYYSAPDAGIQWYRSYTFFAEDGTITGTSEDNWDDSPITTLKQQLELPGNEKKENPAANCAVIYSSEFWYINKTKKTVVVEAKRIGQIKELYTDTVAPGDTAKGGQFILAQFFDEPAKYYLFSISPLKKKKKKNKLVIEPAASFTKNPSAETKRYYYQISGK